MLKFPCKNAFGALALGGKSWQAVLKSKGELGPIHPSWLLCYDKIQGIIGKPVSAPTFDELMQMKTDPMFRSAVESRRVALDLQLVRAPPVTLRTATRRRSGRRRRRSRQVAGPRSRRPAFGRSRSPRRRRRKPGCSARNVGSRVAPAPRPTSTGAQLPLQCRRRLPVDVGRRRRRF